MTRRFKLWRLRRRVRRGTYRISPLEVADAILSRR